MCIRDSPYDYALYFEQDWKPTIQKMVAKDYNHPSVILYCVGNEDVYKRQDLLPSRLSGKVW